MMESNKTKKVAVIGSGISGLTTAYLLDQHARPLADGSPAFDVSVFESASRVGGHTATVEVMEAGQTFAVDTGFIVYNDWTYPNFIALLSELGVENNPTEMSFSVSCAQSGLEYSGNNIDTLFAQRKNLVNPAYLKMLWNIAKFNKQALADLAAGKIHPDMTLGQYLAENNYRGLFATHYLVPMCAAIWSASTQVVLDFPLMFFVKFFKNHGLLSVTNRPQWRVIKNGSSSYLYPLTKNLKNKISLKSKIANVRRGAETATITLSDGQILTFDEIVFACHSDQALQLLNDASIAEKAILSAMPYQNNNVVLHTDTTLLPRNKKTWAAWNYLLSGERREKAVLTYDMNILQSLPTETTYCVTLNATDKIDPKKIVGEYEYAHPVFSLASVAAQQQWEKINGVNKTWFCGAYWGNGFHEDGVVSGKRVANALGVKWRNESAG